MGTCLALHQNLHDATGQNAIKDFFDAHPPKDKKLAAAVRSCRVQEAWGGRNTRQILSSVQPRCSSFETSIMTALEQSGGDRMYRQAPRGSLERKTVETYFKNFGPD